MCACVLVHVASPTQPPTPANPCSPTPCGPNSDCRVVSGRPACTCAAGYISRPPNCRPECTIDAECPGNRACQKERCLDPCPGSCGAQTTCTVVTHAPQCACQAGFTGDPFAGCNPLPQSKLMLIHFLSRRAAASLYIATPPSRVLILFS